MQKTGLCSSGGQGSQDRTAGTAQHTINQTKPVGELHTKPVQHPKTVYIKRVKETHSMQLTNSTCIVDFYPEAFIAEADEVKGMKVVIKRFNKRVTFRANGMKSYSVVGMIDAKNEWAERIAGGAEVTDYHTDKMDRSEYAPMACVG